MRGRQGETPRSLLFCGLWGDGWWDWAGWIGVGVPTGGGGVVRVSRAGLSRVGTIHRVSLGQGQRQRPPHVARVAKAMNEHDRGAGASDPGRRCSCRLPWRPCASGIGLAEDRHRDRV